jgi:hypothetical protein
MLGSPSNARAGITVGMRLCETSSMSRNSFPAGKDVKIFRRHHKYSIVEPKELGQQSPTAKAPQTKEEAWEPEEGLYPHEEEDISGSTSYEEPRWRLFR